MQDGHVGAKDRYSHTIIGWLRGLTESLGVPLSGDSRMLLGHPSINGALSDRIESFTRPLLAVAPWLGEGAIERLPQAGTFASAARATILRGTDPGHPEYWGKMRDIYQPICETSALAWSLHNARPALWDPLSQSERKQVMEWLADVQHRKVSDSNWHLFPALTMAFLLREGYPVGRKELQRHFSRVFEDFYAGGGWYRDGVDPAFDSYNGCQIHPYLLMLDELGAVPQEVSEELRSRSLAWADSLLSLFDEEGVAAFWGRSALYRMTYLDGVAVALRRNLPVARPGDWRRAIAGCCEYFPLGSILDVDGFLLPGYLGRKEDILDAYSVRASAYWLGRLSHLIQVPVASPFWSEEPGAWTEGLVHLSPIPLAANRRRRHVVVWNLGIARRDSDKYHNLLFSGRFGQVYGGGAATLCYKRHGRWEAFRQWELFKTDVNGARVHGKAGRRALEVRFAVTAQGENEIIVVNRSNRAIEVRLGGFAVSGEVKEVPDGLRGVEGDSLLRAGLGFVRCESGGDDGVHLWAGNYRYPVVTGVLAGGAAARAIIAGQPGPWGEVLRAHGGDSAPPSRGTVEAACRLRGS